MTRGRLTLIMASGLTFGVIAYACTVVDAPTTPDAPALVETTSTTAATTTTTEPPRVCEPGDITDPPELFGSPAAQSIVLSRILFECADNVYVVSPAEASDFATAAASDRAPLLIFEESSRADLVAEIERLAPDMVTVTDADSVVDIGIPIESVTRPPTPDVEPSSIWFVPNTDVEPSLLAYSAGLSGAVVLANVQISEFSEEHIRLIRDLPVTTFADLDPTDTWRLSALQSGTTSVSGSNDLLDNTRFVAFYGNPTTPFLGVLGEQGPEATLDRLLPIVEEYGSDGVTAVPTFEIIVTVADAVAGDDGDYSAEMDPALVQPWVDLATANDGYVVLDLQPGRTDFLTQANAVRRTAQTAQRRVGARPRMAPRARRATPAPDRER